MLHRPVRNGREQLRRMRVSCWASATPCRGQPEELFTQSRCMPALRAAAPALPARSAVEVCALWTRATAARAGERPLPPVCCLAGSCCDSCLLLAVSRGRAGCLQSRPAPVTPSWAFQACLAAAAITAGCTRCASRLFSPTSALTSAGVLVHAATPAPLGTPAA